eukprot:3345021-Pleurochrysis_carterae.AAC.2
MGGEEKGGYGSTARATLRPPTLTSASASGASWLATKNVIPWSTATRTELAEASCASSFADFIKARSTHTHTAFKRVARVSCRKPAEEARRERSSGLTACGRKQCSKPCRV